MKESTDLTTDTPGPSPYQLFVDILVHNIFMYTASCLVRLSPKLRLECSSLLDVSLSD